MSSASAPVATLFNALAIVTAAQAGVECFKLAFGFGGLGATASATALGLSVIPQYYLTRTAVAHLGHYIPLIGKPHKAPDFSVKRHVALPLARSAVSAAFVALAVSGAFKLMPPEAEQKLEDMQKAATAKPTAAP